MYSLKPVIDSEIKVPLPDCMYKLKPVNHCNSENSEMTEKLSPELKALEDRQSAILQRLERLKTEVEKMKEAAASSNSNVSHGSCASPATGAQSGKVDGRLHDLVIRADPSEPPAALLVLHQYLCLQYRVLSVSHVHSSVTATIPAAITNIFPTAPPVHNRASFELVFTLMWKDEKYTPSLMTNPTTQTSIQGESNIARYLARLLSVPLYESDSIVRAAEVDTLLDMAHNVKRGNAKEKAAVMRTLNGLLGKSTWLVGSEMSLADIVLWAALSFPSLPDGLPANVKKWLDRCAELKAFKHVLKILS